MYESQQLHDVLARAEAHDSARASRDRAIRSARDAGYSLRAIAAAASISHEQVRRILAAQSDERWAQMERDERRAEGALQADRNAERDARLAKRRR